MKTKKRNKANEPAAAAAGASSSKKQRRVVGASSKPSIASIELLSLNNWKILVEDQNNFTAKPVVEARDSPLGREVKSIEIAGRKFTSTARDCANIWLLRHGDDDKEQLTVITLVLYGIVWRLQGNSNTSDEEEFPLNNTRLLMLCPSTKTWLEMPCMAALGLAGRMDTSSSCKVEF